MKSVQAVERAFAILDALAAEPAGLSETARRVGLPKSTVARLMATLEEVGAVERVAGVYRIGPVIGGFAPSLAGTAGLVARAGSYLERLAATTDEAAGLSIAQGDRMHTIVQVDVDRSVQARDWTGETAALHTVPSGMVLMASWPPQRLARFLERPLERSTEKTLVDTAQIEARLTEIRRRGYAWGKEEFVDGINSVAAPVFDESKRMVAALHVHGPAFRFPQPGHDGEIGELVRGEADRLSESYRLGA
jgi:DNA-binding IclR family transcriptional regulator